VKLSFAPPVHRSTLQQFNASKLNGSTLFEDVSFVVGACARRGAFRRLGPATAFAPAPQPFGTRSKLYDFDGDGWEDLILTGGRGGKLAIFTNDTEEIFG